MLSASRALPARKDDMKSIGSRGKTVLGRLARRLSVAGAALAVLGLLSAAPALADGWHGKHGRGWHGPHRHYVYRGPRVYYAPAPRVYYAPPPVYYVPPPPPPPVYYAPPPVYYGPPALSFVIPLHIR
jgi:hypothetical protein